MKKFNWKAIFIVLMALVLVFALVACDPKKKSEDDNGPTEADAYKYSSVEYFGDLLKLTNNIGDEKIEKDVYISADLVINLGIRKYTKVKGAVNPTTKRAAQVIVGFDGEEKVAELGIKLEAILDRTNEDSRNTVLKAKLYSGDVEIAGIYYALADPKNFYIDFGGQHILLPFEVAFKLGETTYTNSDLGKELYKALGKTIKLGKNAEETTLRDILTAITGKMGEEWSLDDLVNGILPYVGFKPEDIVKLVEGFSKSFAEKLVENGKLSIKKALTDTTLSAQLFTAIKNGNRYSVNCDLLDKGVIGSKISSNSQTVPRLEISYEKEGAAIKDGVTISLDIEDLSPTRVLKAKHPFLAVQIKDLEFGEGESHKNAIAVNKNDYKSDVQLEVKETLDISGVTLNEDELNKQIALGVNLKLDFATAELANNGTQANIYVQYGADKVLDVSYVHGRLAFVVNQKPTLGTYPIADKVVELLGGTIYNLLDSKVFTSSSQKDGLHKFADLFFDGGWEGAHKHIKSDFKGAVWTNIDPIKIRDAAVQKLADLIKAKVDESKNKNNSTDNKQGEQGKATTAASFVSSSVSDLLYYLFEDAIKGFGDGKVELEVVNSLSFISKLVNKMFKLPIKDDNGNTTEEAWSVDGCKKQIKDMIINKIAANDNPGVENNQFTEEQIAAATNEFDKTIEELFTGNAQGKAHLKLAGVNFENKPAETTYIDYLLNALLSTLGAHVTIDCAQGLDWTVEASLAGVKITYKSEMRVNGAPVAQNDLSEGVEKGEEGWYVAAVTA